MKAHEAGLTSEMLRQALEYDPETGVFTWKSKISCKNVIGDVAGWNDNGYVRISLYGQKHMAHRLAWMYVHGNWPEEEVDHINMDRSDNRICNLRQASKQENMQNRPKQKNNKTGFKGVSRDHSNPDRFTAQIHVGRKKHHLGIFDTAEEAHAAYAAASIKHHGEFGRISNGD